MCQVALLGALHWCDWLLVNLGSGLLPWMNYTLVSALPQVYKAHWRGAPAAVKMWSHERSPTDGAAEATRKRTEATLRFRTEAALQVR